MKNINDVFGWLAVPAVVVAILGVAYVIPGLVLGGDPFHMFKPKIYLVDYDCEIKASRLYEKEGYVYSYKYPGNQIGMVMLNKDGTTAGSTITKGWSNTFGGAARLAPQVCNQR